ncbi:MAG: glycosyltransferase family 4 protein [candidate division KSB1 bacterium]|nr:glycosyltransferase family 4 protein [candidate division KSB1 bacterium]
MSEKICITYSIFPHPGGISAIIDDLWEYFHRRYETHICVNVNGGGNDGKYGPYLHVFDRVSFPQMFFPFMWLFTGYLSFHLWRLHRKHRFKCILAQDGYCSGLASLIVGKLSRTKVVIMDHGTSTNVADPFWVRAITERYQKGIGNRLKRFLFSIGETSRHTILKSVCKLGESFLFAGVELDAFYRKHRVPQRKLKKYKHLVNTDFFTPLSEEEKRSRRQREGLNPDALIVNIISRFAEEKGFEYMLPALAQVLPQSRRPIQVLIGGDGVLRGFIENFIQEHGLNNQVRLLGALDREGVRKVMQLSDLHLYAGIMGCSFSIALLEAMACGCASIVTPVPLLHREVITPERGWLVAPKDSKAIEMALREAAVSRSRLRQMGINARRYIEKNHSFAVAGKYFEI